MGKKVETKKQPATGLSAPRITRLMRVQVGKGRIAREARDTMVAREQDMCNYLLDKCVAQMKPLADGAGTRRIKHKHIDAALSADPALASLFGVSARLLKTKRVKSRRAAKPKK